MASRSSSSKIARSLLVLSLSIAGCGFLGKVLGGGNDSSSSSGSRGSNSAAQQAELAAQDDALKADVQAVWDEIEAEGVTAERGLKLTELTARAHQSGAVQRGTVNGPALARSTLDTLGEALAAEPDAAADLQLAIGAMHVLLGEHDEAAQAYVASIDAKVAIAPFSALLLLPASPTVSQAVTGACPTVRPVVSDAEVPDFVEACLRASGGNSSSLQWEGVQADLVAHREEMARREEEQRRREEEERIAAEQAAAEAAKQAQYQVAAVFAAGDCSFGDCMSKGWEIRTDEGTIRVSCNFGDCLQKGWEARFPDGQTARTSCNFGDCMQKGWETRYPDGQTARTSCNFGECATKGWETRLPDGSTARTSCNFGECYTKGWETRLPDGGSVRCSCNFEDCLQKGTDCR